MPTRLGLILLGLFAAWACSREGSTLYKEPPASSYTSQVFHLRTSDKVTPLDGALVSPEFWAATKVMPVLGRPFITEEYTASRNRTVVLISNDLWEESFHSDQRTIGREIDLDGVPATIVGILPPGFRFPGKSRLWVPKESEPM
jgi:putative ABC transport system permease protein